MAIHSPQLAKFWEKELRAGFEQVLTAIAGRPVGNGEPLPDGAGEDARRVNPREVRRAVDKLVIDLREVKGELGKG